MEFGPPGTSCSLLLSIFPFLHVFKVRQTLNLCLLLPSGEVTTTFLRVDICNKYSESVSSMILWWLLSIRERKKKRTSAVMMWEVLITCNTKYKILYVVSNTTKITTDKKKEFKREMRDVRDCVCNLNHKRSNFLIYYSSQNYYDKLFKDISKNTVCHFLGEIVILYFDTLLTSYCGI